MRITNIKRFIKSILLILLVIVLLSLVISKNTFSHKEIEYKTLCVSQGDTLWDIAKSNQKNNEYYKNKDVRYIINDLIKINGLSSNSLTIDQQLIIPKI